MGGATKSRTAAVRAAKNKQKNAVNHCKSYDWRKSLHGGIDSHGA